MTAERVVRIGELEVVHHLREPIDLVFAERERLADLARGAAAAIGDDVGRHRGAEPPVLLVDVLDDALAAIAARQIEIDVGHSPRSSDRKRSNSRSILIGSTAVMPRL